MNRIELTNFRVFENRTAFDLAPITILTGKNNSGKSSLIKAFVLLSDFLQNEEDQTFLNLNGPSAHRHKISKFENLRNWNEEMDDAKDYISIDAFPSTFVDFSYTKGVYNVKLSFQSDKLNNTKVSLVSASITINTIKEELTLHQYQTTRGGFEVKVPQSFIDYVTKDDEERQILYNKRLYQDQYSEASSRLSLVKDQIRTFDRQKDRESGQQYISLIEEMQALENKVVALKQVIDTKKSSKYGIYYQAEITSSDEEFTRPTIVRLIQAALAKYVSGSAHYKFSRSDSGFEIVLFFH